jgi:hypothetical protein
MLRENQCEDYPYFANGQTKIGKISVINAICGPKTLNGFRVN